MVQEGEADFFVGAFLCGVSWGDRDMGYYQKYPYVVRKVGMGEWKLLAPNLIMRI